ncbi:MAG: fatty acid desaturase [Phycisphaerales bacterium]|nr:fatty acid desaturase [Phycisphaerales bacterium]
MTGTSTTVIETEISSNKPPFVRFSLLMGILIPPFALVLAMYLAWNRGFGPLDLILLVGMYLVTGFGITIGFHRYFSHKSFDAPKPVIFLLGFCGSMAMQGPIFWWVATHRCHHQHSDQDLDPHSPYAPGDHGWLRGFWHAHMGWLFSPSTEPVNKYVPDLKAQPMLRWLDSNFLLLTFTGLAIPTVIGGLVTMTWWGAFTGLLWGGLIRILVEHHATWSVNSICHIWGSQPYTSHDESRNNAIVGVVALGEGWHNNHHAFPTSARHGLRWWQFDSSWVVIRLMQACHLVYNVRVPSRDRIEQRRREPKFSKAIPSKTG